MFHRQYRLSTNILLVADSVAAFPALYIAYHFRYYFVRFAPLEISRNFNPELLPFQDYLVYALAALPAWIFLLVVTQRYSDLLHRRPVRQFSRLANFAILTGGLLGFLIYSLKLEVSRPIFFGFLALAVLIMSLNRIVLHSVLRSRNINEHNQIKILVVGTDARARGIAKTLEDSQKWGYHVVGFVRRSASEAYPEDLQVIGTLEELPTLLQDKTVADEVIFTGASKRDMLRLQGVIRLCEDLGIRTRVAADFSPVSNARVSLEFLNDLPLITFSRSPDYSVGVIIKRGLDFALAAVALIVLSPLMLLIAMAVKFTSPGPIFYRQTRCGRYGRKFRLIKFRTMEEGAEDRLWEIWHLNEMDGPVFKMRHDPRVTVLGGFLRKYSLDELPQLWNVIKGEMSIVGPRAPLPEEVQHYRLKQRRRLSVKPGITCLWQVSGRNEVDFQRWMAMDLEYIDNWSVWLDFRIMLKTIPAVFTGRGAR